MTPLAKTISGRLTGKRISAQSPSPNPEARAEALEPNAPPTTQGHIAPSSSLEGLVRQKLAGKFFSDPGIRFGDGTFYLPTREEVEFILEKSQLDRRRWLAERFDCDDFAYVLKGEMSIHAYETNGFKFGLAVGMVWGDFDWVPGFHAVNWFITPDLEILFIEPQTDQIYDAAHCRGNIRLLLV